MTLQEYITKEYPTPAVGYLAEVLGIAKYEDAENMEKADLIRQEAEILLTPEIMASRLSVLTDSQMELFERACREPLTLEPEEQEDGRALSDCRYAFLVDTDDDTPLPSAASLSEEQETMSEVWKAFKRFSANRLKVPDDAVSLYGTMNSPEFQARRRIASRLTVCLSGSAYLYGSTPVSVIRRILERELGEDVPEEKILSLYDSLPSDSKYSSYDAATGRINYRRISGEELAELIQKQEGKDFYIPSLAELNEIYEQGFSSDSPAYAHYRSFLEDYCDIDPDEAKSAAAELSRKISEEEAPQECVQEMIDWSGADSSCAQLLLRMYRNCRNETRFPALCGHTPLEIGAAPSDSPYQEFDLTFDDSVKPVRIGRNDPCPCGSGKKYKKCCMR